MFVFQEVESLSQQLSESRRALEEESGKVTELLVTNNSLKNLVTNTQEALDKEQNIVKSYKETRSSWVIILPILIKNDK